MIFVTVGTEKFPFDRLLKAIDKGVESGKSHNEVFAQIGNSNYVPSSFKFERYLPFKQMINYIQKAEIVITHAGIGSILLCLILDKIPIIFPRYADLKEHVDDHQVEISLRLEKEKTVLVSYNEKDLLHKINHYHQMKKKCGGSIKKPTEKGLLLFLREIIEENN